MPRKDDSESEEEMDFSDVESEEEDFMNDSEDEKPKKTKKNSAASASSSSSKKTQVKKTKPPPSKKTTVFEDSDDEGDEEEEGGGKKKGKGGKKSIEEEYKKLDHVEHALTRPDMYIGSDQMVTQKMWVYDSPAGMTYRKVSFVPGLYKIFDEILVNAADNKQRDENMTNIQVVIDKEQGLISVQNDGRGIPVELHPKEGIYVPELIFGTLLTGSSFNDDTKKVVGGRNGLGAKLANIFSSEFTVETVDSERGKKFKQTFNDNMGSRGKPSVTSVKVKSYTKISFKPDLKRFGMESLDDDIIALMTKRVYDVAGCNPSLKTTLNDERINIKSFQKYCQLYLKDPSLPQIYCKPHPRWEVCISISHDGEFQQCSFVNSICTIRGGSHVKHASEKIVKAVLEAVNKKNPKGAVVKPNHVRNHLWIFVNSLIENPRFDSQTKETLTTTVKDFGSRCDIPEDIMKKILKCGIVENIVNFAKAQSDVILQKKTAGKRKQRLTGIAKLDDANDAGGKNSSQCTLILTEGDSAKALASQGLDVVGREHYGIFPLRGKLLNVRGASHKELANNAEIDAIRQILGLQHGKKHTSIDGLRYGHLMIMTDQDQDGSHIKGLILNFIHQFWPALLKVPGFMTEFITPIVKAKKGKESISFYTIPQYENWKKEVDARGEKGWRLKYYKGLGTSDDLEAKEYFSNIEKHQIDFEWQDENDGELIDMAFNKTRAEDRKNWMRSFVPGTYLDHEEDSLTYSNFINKELILFSMSDCERSIPSMVDGLKPGQRKILFGFFKRKSKDEIKVAQISGTIAAQSAYHHGEVSLQGTIVAMAQNFVGANNINLLYPAGQFGTREMGGKNAASPRYIFTRLCDITRTIFRPEDDKVLDYLEDDGLSVEPSYYCPIIPMALVNGAEGIGTGWSTSIPNHNPQDIVKCIRSLLNGEELTTIQPWYRGFTGPIEFNEKKSNFKVSGVWQIEDDVLHVTELPIGTWTANYKEMLAEMVAGTDKKPAILKDFREYHKEGRVHFEIFFLDGKLKSMSEADLEKTFKLSTTVPTSNMHLFDDEGRIVKYEGQLDIIKAFYDIRLKCYQKRKDYMINELTEELNKLDNRVRFILMVIKEEINIRNRKKADLIKELQQKKFTPFSKKKKETTKVAGEDILEEGDRNNEDDEDEGSSYGYLLSMPLWSLTYEKVQKMMKEKDQKDEELKILAQTTVKEMWSRDLDDFESALDKFYEELRERDQEAGKFKKSKGGRKRAPPKKKKIESDDEDFSSKKKASAMKKEVEPKVEPKKTIAKTEAKAPISKSLPTKDNKASSGTTKLTTFFKPLSSVDEEDLPLAERLMRKNANYDLIESLSSPESKKPKPSATKEKKKEVQPATKKKDVFSALDDEDDLPVTKSKAKRSVVELSDDEAPPLKKAVPAKKSTAPSKKTAAPAKKSGKKMVIEDDDEEEEASFSDESDEEVPSKARAPPRTATGRSKAVVKYSGMDKSDSEDEYDSNSD
eukprot:TRINITY_DN881_c0_g1_i5.p1 TRINITY_DN881_c0_g1~~TRINITY_DN881_c0_g1_i5.p1  ORF type:complete len:1491 (+),score=500.80 TRINITY_DN881_c0_g1_i5:112-4584(+)